MRHNYLDLQFYYGKELGPRKRNKNVIENNRVVVDVPPLEGGKDFRLYFEIDGDEQVSLLLDIEVNNHVVERIAMGSSVKYEYQPDRLTQFMNGDIERSMRGMQQPGDVFKCTVHFKFRRLRFLNENHQDFFGLNRFVTHLDVVPSPTAIMRQLKQSLQLPKNNYVVIADHENAFVFEALYRLQIRKPNPASGRVKLSVKTRKALANVRTELEAEQSDVRNQLDETTQQLRRAQSQIEALLRENDALKAGLGLQLKRKRSIEERPNLTAKFRHLSIAESSRTRDNDIDVD
ncbi:unnamed protein product [Somion occarium]